MQLVLECAWGVAQTEQHHCIFQETIATAESSLPFLTCLHPQLMISIVDVKLGEYLGTTDPVEHLPNQRERILVLFGDLVKTSIVDTKMKGTVGFLDEEDGCATGGLGRSYETLSHVVVDVVLQCFQFDRGYRVQMTPWRRLLGLEVDGVVICSMWRQFVSFFFTEEVLELMIFLLY